MSDTPFNLKPASQPAGANAPDQRQPALAVPKIDLGTGLEVTTLAPGRFANVIQKNTKARHALQVIREETTSSFILKLEPDGSGTVCRGWRYLFFNDGPQVHTMEHIREQLGYCGSWKRRDGWVQLDIRLDDSVCPRVGEYGHLVPKHSPEWHLLCLPIVPRDHPTLITPILACQLTNLEPAFGEEEPHVVPGVIPGRWLVLGPGNGLRFKLESSSISREEPPVVRVELSSEPVRADAWKYSF
jgi:hypothetical protein